MITADNSSVGTGEFAYYSTLNYFFLNYFTGEKGYMVNMQSKDNGTIADGKVTIFDPRSKGLKSSLGLKGDFSKRTQNNYYHNITCILEAKNEYDVKGKNTSIMDILGQLRGYHLNSGKNINAFSIATRGFEISIFMYICDWHTSAKFYNKAADCNGFLCLYVNEHGVQLLPQYDTYEPQVISFNMVGNEFNKHSIHVIFTWISMLNGVPKTDKSLMLSQLNASKNPWELHTTVGSFQNSKILQTLSLNGQLHVFNQNQ